MQRKDDGGTVEYLAPTWWLENCKILHRENGYDGYIRGKRFYLLGICLYDDTFSPQRPNITRIGNFSGHAGLKEKRPAQNVQVVLYGQGWIRTTEVCDGRFTVCSLWPLGNLPAFTLQYFKTKTVLRRRFKVPPGFGPGSEGFADLCLTAWLWHQAKKRAVDETRTRDLHLGKVALYQLSYYRMFHVSLGCEGNCADDETRTHTP